MCQGAIGGSACVPRQPVSRLACGWLLAASSLSLPSSIRRCTKEWSIVRCIISAPRKWYTRESPAWITSHSSPGPMQKAASVLCGSSSAVMAVSLIIRCASCTTCLSMSAASSCCGTKRSKIWRAVSITWSAALRPPLLPPMPSATMPNTEPGTRGCSMISTWSCW